MSKNVSVENLRGLVKKSLEVKTIEFSEDFKVDIKQYLPITEKRVIVELVVKNSFLLDEETKLKKLDSTLKEITFSYLIAKHYTNLNMMNDIFEMYDAIKSTNLISAIMISIPESELQLLEDMIEERIQEEYRIAELSTSIGYKLEDTLGILNRKIAESLDTIKTFDPTALNTLNSFLNSEKTDMQTESQLELVKTE